MIRSMTGFGQGSCTGPDYTFNIELKSVNHRFCEVMVRLPRQFSALEGKVRAEVQKRINRGRIDVYLNLEQTGGREKIIKVDKKLALAYYNAVKEVEVDLDLRSDYGVQFLARMPDVLKVEEREGSEEEYWHYCYQALDKALGLLLTMKDSEGQRLAEDLIHRIGIIEQLIKRIEQLSETVVDDYRIRITDRVKELLPQDQLDLTRLATEIALFAERSSITEELVRLASHLIQFRQDLIQGGTVGRKLDFIIQEMNREINTIGSKANNYSITSLVVEVKSELEKIREQVQNIE